MKTRFTKYCISIILLLSIFNAYGQERNWKEETSKDGEISVKSEILSDDKGKHVYYLIETNTKVTLEQAEEYLRNPSNFEKFLEYTDKSEKVEIISENEWITYMYVNPPWPVANFDCVQKYTFSKTENGFSLKGVVDADAYEVGKVKRMETYTIEYIFEEGQGGENKLSIAANYRPTTSAPKFLLSGWFPNGPVKLITKLLEGAAEG